MKAQRQLEGLVLYNPGLLTAADLVGQFVARKEVFARMLRDLREGGTSHQLIIGQRGMGKTMLLRRLGVELAGGDAWIPLSFPEEQYNVTSLSDFWANSLDALVDALERDDQVAGDALVAKMTEIVADDEAVRAELVLRLLTDAAKEQKKKLVLLVDNLDLILDNLSEDEHWALRRTLSEQQRLVLIGASSSPIPATYDYDAALYDFFRIHQLEGLEVEPARQMVSALAHYFDVAEVQRVVEDDPGRFRALHALSGGNLRTLVLLFELLAQGSEGDVQGDLDRLVDRCTPLYKARFEALPSQSRQILAGVSQAWDPTSAAELGKQLRFDKNLVSAQLNRLVKQGLVQKVSYPPGKKTGFQIAERFFGIWLMMRTSRHARKNIKWLAQFLKLYYGSEHRNRAAALLKASPPEDRRREQVAYMALAFAYGLDNPGEARLLEMHAYEARLDDPLATQKCPGHAIWNDLGGQLYQRGDLARAEIALGHALAIDADFVPALNNQGIVKKKLGKGDEARELLTRATKLDPSHAHAWNALGNVLLEDFGDADGAEAAYRTALAAAPESPLPWLGIGNALRAMQRHEDALRAYERAKDIADNYANAWFALGTLLFDHFDRLDEASHALARALELAPNDKDVLNNYGNLLARMKRFEEAEAMLKKSIALAPDFSCPHNGLGNIRLAQGRYVEAEQAYLRAVELKPTYAHAWNNLGLLRHLSLDDREGARRAFLEAIRARNEFPEAWANLGNVMIADGHFEESKGRFLGAIAFDEECAAAWRGLGFALDKTGQLAEAEAAYRRALAIDEEDPIAANGLAWHLFLSGDAPQEAERLARKATELDPKNLPIVHTLACVLIRREKWEQAAPLIRQMIVEGTEEQHAELWEETVLMFREAVAMGHAGEAHEIIEAAGYADRWKPLYEALMAVQHTDEDRIARLAPEVRKPAEELFRRLREPIS